MTGVKNLFIYWPGRCNFGLGRQFQKIYRLGKPPGRISPGFLDRVYSSNLQFKFHSKIPFNNLYFERHCYFILRLIRVSYTKVCWSEIASSYTRNFAINGQFCLNFLEVRNLSLYFWVMLKGRYFLLGGCTDIFFDLYEILHFTF